MYSVLLDLLASNMFNPEIEDHHARPVLHEVCIEVVSFGKVLLTELSKPCSSFVLIFDDAHLAEADDAPDMEPPVVLLLDWFIYDREAGLR